MSAKSPRQKPDPVGRVILDFLNAAEDAGDLATLLPAEPGERAEEGLTPEIATRLLDHRNELPGRVFRSQEQLELEWLRPEILEGLKRCFWPWHAGHKRNVYLRIEPVEEYSPVDPVGVKVMAPVDYRRDCMRNMGHADGTIPDAEVAARTMTALVYREYLDPNFLIPKVDKLINADVNEPIWCVRVPGTVIYAYPGDTLCITVLNSDTEPHSFHLHGLNYGIDSDGAWPLGTESADGRRSDEICPGQTWTYVFQVTDEMIGCWPFHDHSRKPGPAISRGLFGGLVVLPRKRICPFPLALPEMDIRRDLRLPVGRAIVGEEIRAMVEYENYLEVINEFVIDEIVRPFPRERVIHAPVFFHVMESVGDPLFDSGDLEEKVGTFSHTFDTAGDYDYFCMYHPMMTGTVRVVSGGPPTLTINILDGPMRFEPADPVLATVGIGGVVTWNNLSGDHHTVTSTQGSHMPSHCVNGRAFLGNTPTIVGRSRQKIRFYVFNLDLGHDFHNFHTHDMRWSFAGEALDVRSLSPAESFVVEVEVPNVVLIDDEIAGWQDAGTRPANAVFRTFKGEFVFHCHVHHHMMQGMIAMVRAKQSLWLTPEKLQELTEERGIRLWDSSNECPDVDLERCKKAGEGRWELVPGDPRVAMMHAALMPNTSELLYFGYESRYSPDEHEYSWLWGEATGYNLTVDQLADVIAGGYTQWSMWSSEHTFLDTPEGHLLVHGGYRNDQSKSALFNPSTRRWSTTGATAENRFYSTTITLSDGKALTLYGSGTSPLPFVPSYSFELYDPAAGNWAAPIVVPAALNNHLFYPWTYLLPDGRLFIAGPEGDTHRFDWANPAVGLETFATVHGTRSVGGQLGTSVLLALRPPDYRPRALIIGGYNAATEKNSEIIDLADAAPTWSSPPELELNVERRFQVNSVLLPDGRVFVAGGKQTGPDGGNCEIYDPTNHSLGWQLGPVMTHKRTYHSAMILLTDGSVVAGGDPPGPAIPGGLSQPPTPHERYFPGYFDAARPQITNAPPSAGYGVPITIDTPQGGLVNEVVLLRPGAVTHGFNMSQRLIECVITGNTANTVDIDTPPDAFICPPGWYLLFVLTPGRIPSVGRWIRITP